MREADGCATTSSKSPAGTAQVFCTDDQQWIEPLMAYRSTAFRLEQQPIYLHDLGSPGR